jgi:hypothetical protein
VRHLIWTHPNSLNFIMRKSSLFTRQSLKYFIKEIFLTWYSIAWTVLFLLLFFILTKRINLNTIKAGSFEFTFEQKSKDLNVYNTPEFKNLKNLNETQLKLFLIMGGEDAAYYRFTNTALTSEASKSQFKKLQEASLLNYKELGGDTTMIYPTDVGAKLHKALIQSIYSQVIK